MEAAIDTGRNTNTRKKLKKSFECKFCKAVLKSEFYYNRHLQSRHPDSPKNFICDFDGKQFTNKNYLRSHMERHKQQILMCNMCSKAYNSKLILKRHLLSHLQKYSCNECGATFGHTTLLKNHISIHKKELTFKCNYCTRMFRNAASRNNHHQIAHKNKNELNFKCKDCGVYFETKEDLRIHSFIHFNGEIKSCYKCDQIFKTSRLLKVHLQKHSEKKFQCESCLENFTFKNGLRKHIRLNRCKGPPIDFQSDPMTEEEMAQIVKDQLNSISYKGQKSVQELTDEIHDEKLETTIEDLNVLEVVENSCESCVEDELLIEPKMGTQEESKEIKQKRTGTCHNTYTCDKCGEAIKYRKNLILHMKIHRKRIYNCSYCEETFKSRRTFKNHVLEIHGIKQQVALELYKCAVCDKKFDIKSIFEAHKRCHDENFRPHVCKICNASFKNVGNLKRHSVVHIDERNYLCDLCAKHFKNDVALKIHKKSIHAEMKIYVSCPYCKIIIQEKNLKNHIMNQHTEEGQKKPFKCSNCEKTFKSEFLLKRHSEHVHYSADIGTIYSCGQCSMSFNRQRDLRIHSFQHFEGIIHMCDCGKKFKNKRLLLIHSSTHTSNTKYPCKFCDAIFKTAGGRRKHIAKHHKSSTLKIEDENIIIKYDMGR